ncbi:hypothetical protein GCG21_16030 [Pseudactinotalea sp. HY160]|uniref:hypothetical protein n=1 Tax=Pseudactinotalea sp. HY160 TaxID=2654490 RepID=UPI00128E8C20|nr:hypothetical protein [Pseudactinotalea sp. HY160]MPV51484.1 hypothetical protein [Pseudactinotalea sp. HY160]
MVDQDVLTRDLRAIFAAIRRTGAVVLAEVDERADVTEFDVAIRDELDQISSVLNFLGGRVESEMKRLPEKPVRETYSKLKGAGKNEVSKKEFRWDRRAWANVHRISWAYRDASQSGSYGDEIALSEANRVIVHIDELTLRNGVRENAIRPLPGPLLYSEGGPGR